MPRKPSKITSADKLAKQSFTHSSRTSPNQTQPSNLSPLYPKTTTRKTEHIFNLEPIPSASRQETTRDANGLLKPIDDFEFKVIELRSPKSIKTHSHKSIRVRKKNKAKFSSQLSPNSSNKPSGRLKKVRKRPKYFRESIEETSQRRQSEWVERRHILKKFSKKRKAHQEYRTQHDMRIGKIKKRKEVDEHFKRLNKRLCYFNNMINAKSAEIDLMKDMIRKREMLNKEKMEKQHYIQKRLSERDGKLSELRKKYKRMRAAGKASKHRKIRELRESKMSQYSQCKKEQKLNKHSIRHQSLKDLKIKRRNVMKIHNLNLAARQKKAENLRQLFSSISARVKDETRQENYLIQKKRKEVERCMLKEKELNQKLKDTNRVHNRLQKKMRRVFRTGGKELLGHKGGTESIKKSMKYLQKYQEMTEIYSKKARDYFKEEDQRKGFLGRALLERSLPDMLVKMRGSVDLPRKYATTEGAPVRQRQFSLTQKQFKMHKDLLAKSFAPGERN